MIKIKVPTWLIFTAIVLLMLLLISLFKGCEKEKAITSNKSEISALKAAKDSLIKEQNEGAEREKGYATALELQNGQTELMRNKWMAAGDSIDALNKSIALLKTRYKSIIPAPGSSATVVPNEYVNDCKDCFDKLDKYERTAGDYRDGTNRYIGQLKERQVLDSNRILELTNSNHDLVNTTHDAINAGMRTDSLNKQLQPHGRLLFSMSTMAINGYWPNAAGIGFGYLDKRYKLYSAKIFGSEYGTIYQAEIFLPLSLRKRK